MKTLQSIRYLPIVLIVFTNCQKDSANKQSQTSFILAGQTDNLTHLTFPEDTIFNGEQADINQDGVYEFVFNRYFSEMTQQDCDVWMVNNCPLPLICDCFPWTDINSSIKYHVPFNVMRHLDDDKPYPLPLELNDTISNDKRWAESDSGKIYHDHVVYGLGVDHYGLWPWNEYKYLGFRWQQAQDTLFGWVKMKYNGDLIIAEIAYQE